MTWIFSGIKNDFRFAYLLEALKVEGYWSVKNGELSIQNRDLNLLKYIESILIENGLRVQKRFLVKMKPKNQNFTRESVFVIYGGRKIPVRIEYSPFDSSKKLVFNLPFGPEKVCKVCINQHFFDLKVSCENILGSFCPEKSFVYLELRSHASNFIRYLERVSGGRGADKIRLTSILDNASAQTIGMAFSALLDCEGTIDHYGPTRRLRIRMINEGYLNGWSRLLSKHGIGSSVTKDCDLFCLTISGLEDFENLNKIGLKLRHSTKSVKWDKIISSYIRRQVSWGKGSKFYMNKIKEIGTPVTAKNLAETSGKSKRVVNHYLTKLVRGGWLEQINLERNGCISLTPNPIENSSNQFVLAHDDKVPDGLDCGERHEEPSPVVLLQVQVGYVLGRLLDD